MDASSAVLRAQQATLAQRVSTPELVVYPSTPPRLAWRMTASPDDIPAEWEVLMDADTGEIIYLMGQVVHAHMSSAPAKSAAASVHAVVDGTGLVFDPDPLTTAGVEYGGAYVDSDDADVEELNAQRKEVVLRDITLDSDGRYRLTGPYVEITGNPLDDTGTAWTPPAETDPNAFRYGRANDSFEAVMAYYHIDQNQRYIQSLDVGYPIMETPVLVNPHDTTATLFIVNPTEHPTLVFGDEGIDSAEDADFILNTYAWMLVSNSVPSIWFTTVPSRTSVAEGPSFAIGWGFYWGASYSRGLAEAGRVPTVQDWREPYNWHLGDLHPSFTLNPFDAPVGDKYPEDAKCDDFTCTDGIVELWPTTMMEIYDDLGKAVADRLHLASLAYLSSPFTYYDAAEALLQADDDLHGGENRDALTENLTARGYLQEVTPPPKIQTSTGDVGEVPEGYVLEQNYPNPFNPVTTIRYDLATVGHVSLEVSDLLGRRVAVLVDEVQQTGAQEVRFDARNLPSGMYLYRLQVEDFVSVKKMVLLE